MAELYLDHNVSHHLVPALIRRGHGVRTARDLGLERAGDDEQLLTAAQQGWPLITYNRKDFILLHSAWWRWARAWNVIEAHGGILLLPEAEPDVLAAAIDELLQAGAMLDTALYEWRRPTGWRQHVEP